MKTENNKKTAVNEEKKIVETKIQKEEKKEDKKMKDNIVETKVENKEEEEKSEEKEMENVKEEKKQEKTSKTAKEKIKKEVAIARGYDLNASPKVSKFICKFIKGKNIERAISELEEVARLKRAVPMIGEYPHRKMIGSGRYPVNVSRIFIKLLKSLNANCQTNEIENAYISLAKADIASRPHKRFGSGRFKRAHVYLEARSKMVKEGKI